MALDYSVKSTNSYTIVGTPTISNGVVSNFSSSNYLKTSELFDSSTAMDDFEAQVEITVPSSISGSGEQIFYFPFEGLYSGFRIYANRTISWYIFSSRIVINAQIVLDVGKNYFIKGTIVNKIANLYIKEEGQNWQYCGTADCSAESPTSNTFAIIGNFAGDNSQPFSGAINLNNTYVRIENTAWFGVCPIEVKHINYGTSVGYTKVGSPTITNGIISNIDNSNYVKSDSNFNALNAITNGLEIQTKIVVPSAPASDGEQIINLKTSSASYSGFRIGPSRKPVWFISNNPRIDISTNDQLDAGASYYLKGTIINKIATFSYKKEGGSWTVVGTADLTNYTTSSNDPILFGTNLNQNQFFSGSIDLNATYVKINNELWLFKPVTNYLIKDSNLVWSDSNLYLSGQVNYSTVGNITIEDNIAKEFSENDYLAISSFPILSKDWEIVIQADTTGTNQERALDCNGMYLRTINKYWNLYFAGGDEIWGQSITEYPYVKITKSGTTASFYCSTDGSNYILQQDNINIGTISDGNLYIGGNTSLYWTGTINLNNTYSKVDNDLWFYGKIYASDNIIPVPANFTYGSTTTSSVGYVNVKTQIFTASPQGTTISR